jgi:hypothetical protein
MAPRLFPMLFLRAHMVYALTGDRDDSGHCSVNGLHPRRFAEIHKALAEADAGDFATAEEITTLITTYHT